MMISSTFQSYRASLERIHKDTNLRKTILEPFIKEGLVEEAKRILKDEGHPFYSLEYGKCLFKSAFSLGQNYALRDPSLVEAGAWWVVVVRAVHNVTPVWVELDRYLVEDCYPLDLLAGCLENWGCSHVLPSLMDCFTKRDLFSELSLEAEIINDARLLSLLTPSVYKAAPQMAIPVSSVTGDILKSLRLKSSKRSYRALLESFDQYVKGKV